MNNYVNGFLEQPQGFATKAIHVGQDPEQWSSNAVIPPIVTSTTYKQLGPAEHKVNYKKKLFINRANCDEH